MWRCWIGIYLLLMYSLVGATEPPMIIKYPNNGTHLPTFLYRFELIELLLKETKTEYGDYHIAVYDGSDPGVKRQALLISQGEQINVLWASPGTAIANADVIVIPVDILQGMLGHRICLINRSNSSVFDAVTDLNSLRQIRLGQGLGWSDVEIYSFNKIPTILPPTFEGLFGMLATKRFDCLPLGIDEINSIYESKVTTIPMLGIEQSLQIYYDFPIYLYVSAKYPRIAERLKAGMKKIQANGKLDRLFKRYFHGIHDNLHLNKRRVICLKSPYLPLDKQCLNPKHAKAIH